MLDQVLKWIGAGDQAITVMGPVLTIVFAWLGGFGITQLAKFPMSRIINDVWMNWCTRSFAAVVTASLAWWIGEMPLPLNVVIGVAQPCAVWFLYWKYPNIKDMALSKSVK